MFFPEIWEDFFLPLFLYICVYISVDFVPQSLRLCLFLFHFLLSFSGCSLYCSDFNLLLNPLREFCNSALLSSGIAFGFLCSSQFLLRFSVPHSEYIFLYLFDHIFYLWNTCFIMNSRSYWNILQSFKMVLKNNSYFFYRGVCFVSADLLCVHSWFVWKWWETNHHKQQR